ncbi:unnamed protein product, partial [Didymodactylos carnosus]
TSPSQQFNQTNLADRLNSDHQFHLFPYLMSPYYNGSLYNGTPPFVSFVLFTYPIIRLRKE